ncbi:WD40 repeat-like protein [Punctularia strigosozonata HHB-11173 SS5]|uniref:WD40 repeat-like protein n=1 Tax=Punctularia strigosozonata (strain HHB-11173) TaxID=741275 RepID=UPI00044175D1|nr:WD40 repeat-like protein [Punctularia strigosozonata HHB-11173 SS5]EIN10643.1 WD40 repeat-like protein [Punctularia strigosozonata HHB-11173 SS5]
MRTVTGYRDAASRGTTPSWTYSSKEKRRLLSQALHRPLDRVGVLGSDTDGHTGCVNTLSWARDGELLLSGGDDTTVRIWRMDTANTSVEYPFACEAVIHTGHRANIFGAKMLPGSSRIATVAGDREVRICDISRAPGRPQMRGTGLQYDTSEACVRVLRCHKRRTKRIVTEESFDRFLTVAEDGAVIQHDLRTSHRCGAGSCPTPLIKVPHELSAIAVSPLAPYHIVVAGESPYGYLFDRRQSGRHLREQWGMAPDGDHLTTCVRRFGRTGRAPGERVGHEHITGARMAQSNGHEVLLSYSADAVYLYSTRDDVEPPEKLSSLLESTNTEHDSKPAHSTISTIDEDAHDVSDLWEIEQEEYGNNEEADGEDDDYDEEVGEDDLTPDPFSRVPVVLPRSRYAGACNVETVKDVNFLGPNDEFVASGSDDGNFFIWKKTSRRIHGVYEGDGSVVNVIERHPHLPLLAVSGIDTTVKLFAPAHGRSRFSRLGEAESIMQTNIERAERTISRQMELDLASLLLHHRLIVRRRSEAGDEDVDDEDIQAQCPTQ